MQQVIESIINEDVQYSKQPLDLRYQRTFAVKVYVTICVKRWILNTELQAGINGLLDVARTTFKENSDDAVLYLAALSGLRTNPR